MRRNCSGEVGVNVGGGKGEKNENKRGRRKKEKKIVKQKKGKE